MYRVIYYPNPSFSEEAERLSRIWNLPLQEGDSPRTEDLEFPRDEVCVLSVPTDKQFQISSASFVAGSNVVIKYINDYTPCKHFKLALENQNYKTLISPFFAEKHIVSFKFRPPIAGKYEALIIDHDIMIDKEFFEIKEAL
jgi:hypothetical protein